MSRVLNKSEWTKVRRSFLSQFKHFICHYCYQHLEEAAVTVDHKIPISQGGEAYQYSNLLVSCKDCNSLKGSRLPNEFHDWKQTISYKIADRRLKRNNERKRTDAHAQFFTNTELSHIEVEEILTPGLLESQIQMEILKDRVLIKFNQFVLPDEKSLFIDLIKSTTFYKPIGKNIKVNVIPKNDYYLFQFKAVKGRMRLLGRIRGEELYLKVVDCKVKDLAA